MSTSIKTTIRAALNAAHTYGEKVEQLRKELKGQGVLLSDSKAVRAAITQGVADYYKCAVRVKERGEGVTLDREDRAFDAAEQAIKRLTRSITGAVVKQAEEVAVPRKLLAAVKALLAEGYSDKQIRAALTAAK